MFKLIALVLVSFSSVSVALAGDPIVKPFPWNMGQLTTEIGRDGVEHGVVVFEDGQRLPLTNLVVSEEKAPDEEHPKLNRKYRHFEIFMPHSREFKKGYKFGKDFDFTTSFVSAFLVPSVLGAEFVPGLKIAYSEKEKMLFWVFESYSPVAFKSSKPKNSIQAVMTKVRLENEGVVLNDKSFQTIENIGAEGFQYLRNFKFGFYEPGHERAPLIYFLDHDFPYFFVLRPDTQSGWKHRLPKNFDGELVIVNNPENRFHGPALQNKNGEIFYLFSNRHFFAKVKTGEKEKSKSGLDTGGNTEAQQITTQDPDDLPWTDWMHELRKAHHLGRNENETFWLESKTTIRSSFPRPAETPSIDVSEEVNEWFKALSLGKRPSRHGVISIHDNSKYKMLALTISAGLHKYNPKIRDTIVNQIIETIESKERNASEKNDFFYFHLSDSNDEKLEAIRFKEQLYDHLSTKYSDQMSVNAEQKPNLVLILDGLDTSKNSNFISNFLNTFWDKSGSHLTNALANVKIVTLQSADRHSKFREWYYGKSSDNDLDQLQSACIDCMLPESELLAAAAHALRAHGANVSVETLKTLLTAIRAENLAFGKEFLSVTDFAEDIAFIFKNANIDPSSQSFGLDVARVYNQMNGVRTVIFDRNSSERVNKLYDSLSVNGANPLEEPLLELDDQIHLVQEIFLSKRNEKRLPYLPVLFFGPGGTGKTLFAQNLATALNARTEIYNVGTLPNPKSGAPLNLGPILEKIRLLLVHPGLKVLILEEIDKNPAIFSHLMAALDPQQKGQKTLNLEGLIILCTMNLRKEAESYGTLSKLRPSEFKTEEELASYNRIKFEVASVGISGGEENELQNAQALVGRFFKGLVFVPSIKEMRRSEKEAIVEYQVKRFQKDSNIRILLRESSKTALVKTLDENANGNFRTALSAVQDRLNLSATLYKEDHPNVKELTGYFILDFGKDLNNKSALKLTELDKNNGAVVANLVSDYLNIYNSSLINAVDHATDVLRDELKRSHNIGINQEYLKLKRFSEALKIISKTGLLDDTKKGAVKAENVRRWVIDFPLFGAREGILAQKQRTAITSAFTNTFLPLFETIAPVELGPPLSGDRPPVNESIAQVVRIIHLVDTLLNRPQSESEKFQKWADALIARYKSQSAEALNFSASDLKRDITSTAVLAALIANDMGRSYAMERLERFLPKSDSLSPAPQAAETPELVQKNKVEEPNLPPRTAECDAIVNALITESSALKKIF